MFPSETFDTRISCNMVTKRVANGTRCDMSPIDIGKEVSGFMRTKSCGEKKKCCAYVKMESAIEQLLKRHPNIDRMMAETLLTLHEQGKLEKFRERLDETPMQQPECVVHGITVESPE